MYLIGKKNINKKTGFSLIEIIVSLGLFSFIITAIVSLSIQMVATQKRIQAQLFLTQTAQTTIENMSRNLRYAYNYSGTTDASYAATLQTIIVDTQDISNKDGSSASSTQILANAENSPFILFESQGGNPNSFSDQNAFCVKDDKLYKVTSFIQDTTNANFWKATCDSGYPMLPENIIIEKISFDIVAGISENPKNPMVRIKMRLKHDEAGSVDMQTTVTQRLVTYF